MNRGRAGAGKPYGSVYKWNSARNAYELRERKEPDASGTHLLLKHRKTNIGRHQPDLALRLNWDDEHDVARWERETFAAAMKQPVPEQIIDLLQVGPCTPRQIADLLSDDDAVVNEIDVRRELKGLIAAGRVNAGGDGQIRLAQEEKAVPESTLLADD
jgi:hypothetical protein